MLPSVHYFKNYFSQLNNVNKTPDFDQTTALPIGIGLLGNENKTMFIDCDRIAAPPIEPFMYRYLMVQYKLLLLCRK